MSFASTFFIICCFLSATCNGVSYPAGDIRNCPTRQLMDSDNPLLRMDALPGLGFDNLRNIELGQVFNWNYTKCQVSNDGYYLLPDNIYLVPVLNSEVDFFANVYDHFDDWKSTTSYSINAELKVSWAGINGKFSAEYQDTKTKMVDTNSRAVRVGLRHHLYSVHVNPDAQLNPSFKSRLMDLASHIQSNNTEMAHYLSDLLVRDYGTHVVTSVEAGAALYQTTFVSRDFMNNSETSRLTMSASASASFFHIFSLNIDAHYTKTVTDVNGLSNFTRHLRTSTHGGPPFKVSNFSYADWENGIRDNLIAINRRGQPLFSAVTTTNVPELPDMLLMETADYIYQAIARYYRVNTHRGCTDFGSTNFNFLANIDDKSCRKYLQNNTFGGIYQICSNQDNRFDVCGAYGSAQTNPLTQDYSCPSGYRSILLHTGTLSKIMPRTAYGSHCGWFSCKSYSYQVQEMHYSYYRAYWCYYPLGQAVPRDSGYMFGGVYTSKYPNAVTGTSACPPFFYPLHFANDIRVCVGNDIEGLTYSLPFGGFHSCSSGNPLSMTPKKYVSHPGPPYPLQCPERYNQFLVTVDQGCIVNYCTQISSLLAYTPQPPVLPPYRIRPPMTVNQSDSLVIVGPYGTVWVKGDDGTWSKYESGDEINGYSYVQSVMTGTENVSSILALPLATPSDTPASIDLSVGKFAGLIVSIVVGSVISTVVCAAMTGCFWKARSSSRRKESSRNLGSDPAAMYSEESAQQRCNETTVLVER